MGAKIKYTALGCVLGVWIYSLTQPLYMPTAIPVGTHLYPYPTVIAHKSLTSNTFPGNSLSAIQEALASTVDGIEVDVRMSKDGVLFLYHGETLEDYTDQKGRPEDTLWANLSHTTYKGTGEKIVSLDTFFNLVGTQKTIFLDMKSPHLVDRTFINNLVDAITKHDLKENV